MANVLGYPPGVVEKRNFLLYHRPNTSAHVNSPAYDFQGAGREGATTVVRWGVNWWFKGAQENKAEGALDYFFIYLDSWVRCL